jgi:hypothetical protein
VASEPREACSCRDVTRCDVARKVGMDATSYVVNFEDLSIRRGKTLDFKLELTAITKGSECTLRRSKGQEPNLPHAFVPRVDEQHVSNQGCFCLYKGL